MTTDARSDAMRRHVAALHFSIAGPDFVDLLDPRHVLVGAGPAIPEKHRPQYSGGLAKQRRHLVYFEFASDPDALRPVRIHVVEPDGTGGAYWFEDCVLWTADGLAEMEIVPVTPGVQARFVGRSGGLQILGGRPPELEQGRVRAEERFLHTVRSLTPHDLEGQNRTDAADGSASWWQHQGFRIVRDLPAY